MLYFMATLRYPFTGATSYIIQRNIISQEIEIPDSLSQIVRDILRITLVKERAERATIDQIMERIEHSRT